jgi:starvation-inducible DNA-binding protein
MKKIEIGITGANLQSVSSELAKILSDEVVLCNKSRNAHWNMIGFDFYCKHKFYESHIQQLNNIIDEVAERIRCLGHFAPSTMKSYLELTHLSEEFSEENNSQGSVHELLSDHESMCMMLRALIKPFENEFHDAVSSDFIAKILNIHESIAWQLRSHMEVKVENTNHNHINQP